MVIDDARAHRINHLHSRIWVWRAGWTMRNEETKHEDKAWKVSLPERSKMAGSCAECFPSKPTSGRFRLVLLGPSYQTSVILIIFIGSTIEEMYFIGFFYRPRRGTVDVRCGLFYPLQQRWMKTMDGQKEFDIIILP